MPKIIKAYNFRSTRKIVFETGDLRLWLKTKPGRGREKAVVALGLGKLKTATLSKWETLWSGTIKTEDWGATVETKSTAATTLTLSELAKSRSVRRDKPIPSSLTKRGRLPMAVSSTATHRRWERQTATIPINLELKAEDLKVDNSATIVEFSMRGVGVLTSLALVPGERVRIVAKGEFPDAIPTRVAWVRQDESNHWTFAGLEFLEMAEA